MFYSDPGPQHQNSDHANQTLYWTGMDNQEDYRKNLDNPTKRRLLESLGYGPNDPPITYQYNRQGFRCDQFDDRPAGIALGCSHTEGVGLRLEESWPSVLSQISGHHVWNLGVGGSGSTTCFRLLDHYIHLLNVEFVILCQPSPYRFEFCNHGNFVNVLVSNFQCWDDYKMFFQTWFVSDENSLLDARRNELAIQHLCQEKGVPVFVQDSALMTGLAGARDLAHHHRDQHRAFALEVHRFMHQQGI